MELSHSSHFGRKWWGKHRCSTWYRSRLGSIQEESNPRAWWLSRPHANQIGILGIFYYACVQPQFPVNMAAVEKTQAGRLQRIAFEQRINSKDRAKYSNRLQETASCSLLARSSNAPKPVNNLNCQMQLTTNLATLLVCVGMLALTPTHFSSKGWCESASPGHLTEKYLWWPRFLLM